MIGDPIEPELLLPDPRPVRRRVPLDWHDRWQRISAILMLGGLWALYGWQGRFILPHFFHNGTAAGVIAEQVIPERESAYVVYRYPAGEGTAEARQVIQFEQRPLLQPGTPVTVRVLQIGPWRFSALAVRSPMAASLLFVGGMFLIATLMILGFQYGWPRVQRRLFSRGVPARGVITGISSFTRRGSTAYYIHYEFTTEAGRLIRTKMTARKADHERAQSDRAATVLYARGFPRNNLLYDYADFTCRT